MMPRVAKTEPNDWDNWHATENWTRKLGLGVPFGGFGGVIGP